MIRRQIENGRHLALRLALAHQRSIAAAAERQGESIEQDRFAGAGLAGQHGQARAEGEIEAIDENDVADGELDEHRSDVGPRTSRSATALALLRTRRCAVRLYPNPTFLKVLEIQDSWCSSGDNPPVCRRAKASLYHCESG